VLESLIKTNSIEEGNKRDTNRKEISLFADDMSVYIGELKDSTRKLLDLMNTLCKVTNTINIQISVAFLYTVVA
jgi:tRNA A37 methylthiotransferase MiaB